MIETKRPEADVDLPRAKELTAVSPCNCKNLPSNVVSFACLSSGQAKFTLNLLDLVELSPLVCRDLRGVLLPYGLGYLTVHLLGISTASNRGLL